MRYLLCAAGCLGFAMLAGAADLSPVALRLVGQPRNFTNGFNLVEGRELWAPESLAIDLSASPAHLYVADTLNNRVLGWRDAAGFASGSAADLVIGQPDFFGANPNATSAALGLWQPSGVAVDTSGNLYIADTNNHRVLRYPLPFAQSIRAPDLAIGQKSFTGRDRNIGAADPGEFSLAYPVAVALSPKGDLAVSDGGNHRVLVFPAGSLAANGPAAAAVLGQSAFSTSASGVGVNGIDQPAGLAFDSLGRLWVADSAANRVLEYPAMAATGTAAVRVIGGNRDDAPRGSNTLFRPLGVTPLGDNLYVADTGNHRVLRFTAITRSVDPRPAADAVWGQVDLSRSLPNGASRAMPLASAQSLASPAQIAFGANQEMFVADAGNNRVLAVPQIAGRYADAARVLGQDDSIHNAPNLLEGRELSTSNILATPIGPLVASGGIAVDIRSTPPHVYIADTANHRVLAWRDVRGLREGARADVVIGQPDLQTAVANYGSSAPDIRPPTATNLNRPSGLGLDSTGNLFVTDTGNNRVLRFPRPFEQTSQVADLVIGQPALAGSAVEGTSAFLLNHPTGIAVRSDRGDLLVADTLNHRVLYFPAPLASGMAATRVFGETSFTENNRGASSAAMTQPTAVAFDADDNIYVADTGNSRILVFGRFEDLPATGAAALATGAAPIGQPDFVTAASGTANNRLRNPTALSVNWTSGDLWVADTGNHRVLRFPPLAVLATNGGAAYSTGGLFGQLNFTARTTNVGAASPGQASLSGLNSPNALALDAMGNLLVGDGNARAVLYFPQAVSVSAATFLPGVPLAPGMLASLFGAGLSAQTAQAGLPLPATLGDTQVFVNDAPAPLLYVSPGQINYQAPWSLQPGAVARVEVVRASAGQTLAGGTLFGAPAAAGIFGVLNQDGSINAPSNPAARGSLVQIFATGQGMVTRPPADGFPAPAAPLAETPARPLVTIGTSSERDVMADFSGLAPGFVGLWQINARVPDPTVPGSHIPLLVRYGGSASNVVFIAVR
jgi:uncharacterized protein (TIGR03437 family)